MIIPAPEAITVVGVSIEPYKEIRKGLIVLGEGGSFSKRFSSTFLIISFDRFILNEKR